MSKWKKWGMLALFIAIPQILGLLGAWFTSASVANWYLQLEKPWFNPPSVIFGIVWPLLYLLMGIASWLVWKKGTHRVEVRIALWLYGIHLLFNVLWSFLFFTMQSPFLALVDITILFILIIVTTVVFYKINVNAGRLMVPYIAWVSFAILLNASIWYLN